MIFFLSKTGTAAIGLQIVGEEMLMDTGMKSGNSMYQFYFNALLSGN